MDVAALTCRELAELVTDYLEDVLSPRDRRAFEQHLDQCVDCRNHLEQLRATVTLAGRLRPGDLSPEAESALLEIFRGRRVA